MIGGEELHRIGIGEERLEASLHKQTATSLAYLKSYLLKIEKRIFEIIGFPSNVFPSLISVGDKIGSNLF